VAYDAHQRRLTEDWAPVRDLVRRFALKRLGRPDLAEDIAQETLLRMVEYGESAVIDSPYALALRISENLVNEHHRRERRWGGVALSESLPSPLPPADRVVEGREAVQALTAALQKMPRLRRDIIVRRRVNHQSCTAIAEELGLSIKAVEKHVTRGLLDLNKAFGKSIAIKGKVR
jgi:RNA polymerase sigma factor (sigma-70 family)